MSALVLRASDHLEKSVVTVARLPAGAGIPEVVLGVTPGEGPSRNPKRQPNEDSLGAVAIPGGVAVCVADSHFGARAGEALVAAALAAVERGAPGTGEELREVVLSLDAAHERLLEDESETTLLLAVVRGRRVAWASVADSVLFRIGPAASGSAPRRPAAVRLNAAGSYFAGGGFLLRDLAKRLSPWRVVDAGDFTLEPGELLLLASDGLEAQDSGLEEEDVAALLVAPGSLDERVRALVARAGSTARGGGRDNVAVAAVVVA